MQKEANKTGISTPYRYFAFISYNSKDTEWGKKVQRKLEKFRLPSTLCSERDLARRPIRPFVPLVPFVPFVPSAPFSEASHSASVPSNPAATASFKHVNGNSRTEVCSIDYLESFTGIDFFCNVPDAVEDVVEKNCRPNQWTGLKNYTLIEK